MKDIFELQNPSYNLRSSSNQFRRENRNYSLWLTVRKIFWPKNISNIVDIKDIVRYFWSLYQVISIAVIH